MPETLEESSSRSVQAKKTMNKKNFMLGVILILPFMKLVLETLQSLRKFRSITFSKHVSYMFILNVNSYKIL